MGTVVGFSIGKFFVPNDSEAKDRESGICMLKMLLKCATILHSAIRCLDVLLLFEPCLPDCTVVVMSPVGVVFSFSHPPA